MKVKEIRYIRRKNLGNYEYEEIEFVAELNEFEDRLEAIAEIKKDARVALDIPDPESEKPF